MLRRHNLRFFTEYCLVRAVTFSLYGLLMISLSDSQWQSPAYSFAFSLLPRQVYGVAFLAVGIGFWWAFVEETRRAHAWGCSMLLIVAGLWSLAQLVAFLDGASTVGGPIVWAFIASLAVVSLRDIRRDTSWI